jgi:hydroxymethylbilane synthase
MRLVIGSRGSQLALTQTNMIADLLRASQADLEVAVVVIRTHGDVATGPLRSFGGQGVFTKELEAALLAGEIDLAVHSLKDLPTDGPEGLVVVASPPREDVRDVLVSRFPGGLSGLPPQARLGTGSRRRRAQLLALRPDLEPAEIRGNLDTRIAKVTGGEFDAIVLAAAGLHRLGWRDRISAYLETDQVLPAVGQGALGLQMRADSPWRSRVAPLGDADTLAAVTAERALLHALGGGCHAPIAAWGRVEAQALRLDALVGAGDGTRLLRASVTGPVADAEAIGTEAARQLLNRGARELLATAEPTT